MTRVAVFARLVLLAILAVGCSNGGSSNDAGSDASGGDGGVCLATSAACVRASVCVSGDCGGSCCVGACLGPDDASVCVAPNVDFSDTCAPSCTGGDPTGTWSLVGGCGGAGCASDAGSGTVGPLGTLVVAENGGTGLDLREALSDCSRYTLGNTTLGGSYSPDAGTVGGASYCVQGSTLYLFLKVDPQSASDPHLTALKLVK